MEVMEKTVYVDVNEVCADWGVCQARDTYIIIKELSERMKKRKSRSCLCGVEKNQSYLLQKTCMKNMYEEITDDEV